MFINGDALGRFFLFLNVVLVVLVATSVAHLVWIVRLTRLLRLQGRSGMERMLLVALAFATPVSASTRWRSPLGGDDGQPERRRSGQAGRWRSQPS